MKTVLRNKRAISPVIATVILVAVAISVAVAVAYWMGGIAGMYTKFEKIEIQSAYAPKTSGTPDLWNITMGLKNTGSADATLTHAYINNVPTTTLGVEWRYSTDTVPYTPVPASGLIVISGKQLTVYLIVQSTDGSGFSSGQTLNIKLHSAGGMDYIKLVELT